jgi:uncharacterized protein YqjF (DUF2071 family)
MPDAPWIMTQTWHDLLFAHWPADRGSVESRLPPSCALDRFAGQAWIGIVAFEMSNVAPRVLPAIDVRRNDETIAYRSRRRRADAAFDAIYQPVGPAAEPRPGSLERFLTERYCLYTVDRANRLMRCDIHHPPWLLQPATADIRGNTLTDAAGIRLPAMAPILHFSKRQDTVNWPLVRLASRA